MCLKLRNFLIAAIAAPNLQSPASNQLITIAISEKPRTKSILTFAL